MFIMQNALFLTFSKRNIEIFGKSSGRGQRSWVEKSTKWGFLPARNHAQHNVETILTAGEAGGGGNLPSGENVLRVIGSTTGASPACSPGRWDPCTPGAGLPLSWSRRGGERGPKTRGLGPDGWRTAGSSTEARSILQSAPASGAAAPHLLRQRGSGIKASRACLEALQST